ncbi:hypothetical protein [Staphylococcus schweitzeri]|nr:hypothetical protein [Staphylococcus schweitzeri]
MVDIFEDYIFPFFYSYKILDDEHIYITNYADFDEEQRIRYFMNAKLTKSKYDKFIKGKIEIRDVFQYSETFFTKGSPEELVELEPLKLNLPPQNILPDEGLYLVVDEDGEFDFIDYKEFEKEISESQDQQSHYISEAIYDNEKKAIEDSKNNGLIFTFSEDNKILELGAIGEIMSLISSLFNHISYKKLDLNVYRPFEGSFGISLDIVNENLDLEDERVQTVNKFMTMFNFVNSKKNDEFFDEFKKIYSKKEKQEFLKILDILSSNRLDMRSVYFENNNNNIYRKFSNLSHDEIQKFINKNVKDDIYKEKIELEGAKIYKIDVKNNTFGLTHNELLFTGKIGETIKKNKDMSFTVPSIKNVKLVKIRIKNEFTQKEKIDYILTSIDKHVPNKNN